MGECVLTPRDKKLFYDLFRFKLMSLEAIHDRVFGNAHYTAMTRRLRKLETGKLISRDAYYDEGRMISLFGLSAKGILQISLDQIVRNQFKSNYPEHDLKLERILYRLRSFKMIEEVILENELLGFEKFATDPVFKEFVDLRPDAVLRLKIRDHTFLVSFEYELNSKSSTRWKDKFLDYYAAGTVDAVLYVCESISMMNKMILVDRELNQTGKSKIYFCDKASIFNGNDKICFENSSGGEFLLS